MESVSEDQLRQYLISIFYIFVKHGKPLKIILPKMADSKMNFLLLGAKNCSNISRTPMKRSFQNSGCTNLRWNAHRHNSIIQNDDSFIDMPIAGIVHMHQNFLICCVVSSLNKLSLLTSKSQHTFLSMLSPRKAFL